MLKYACTFDFFNYFISWLDVFSVWSCISPGNEWGRTPLSLQYLREREQRYFECNAESMILQGSSIPSPLQTLIVLSQTILCTPIAFVFLWICLISLVSNILIRIPPVGRMALLQSNFFAAVMAMMSHLVLSLARLSSFSIPYRTSLAA